MTFSSKQRTHVVERAAGLCREVGTLLVAFAPLDYSMQHQTVNAASLAGFLVTGGVLFALSIFIELRIAK